MPNGGSDNCGECSYFSRNVHKIASEEDEKLSLPYCTLRRVIIKKNPFWIYCDNYQPGLPQQKAEATGPVFVDSGKYPYSRKVWITEEKQAFLIKGQEALADFSRKNLNLENPKFGEEFTYANLPLCVIDAVFSIGVKYTSVENVGKRFKDRFCPNPLSAADATVSRPGEPEMTVRDLIRIYEEYGVERMANEVYQNRNLTSTKSGILKAEAVLEFSRVLVDIGVDRLADVKEIIGNSKFEEEIKKIPGQNSGVSLAYFYILIGAKDYVKPDRMIKRFLENLLGKKVTADDCHQLIFGASLVLAEQYPYMRACYLDHLVWRYQSGRQLT